MHVNSFEGQNIIFWDCKKSMKIGTWSGKSQEISLLVIHGNPGWRYCSLALNHWNFDQQPSGHAMEPSLVYAPVSEVCVTHSFGQSSFWFDNTWYLRGVKPSISFPAHGICISFHQGAVMTRCRRTTKTNCSLWSTHRRSTTTISSSLAAAPEVWHVPRWEYWAGLNITKESYLSHFQFFFFFFWNTAPSHYQNQCTDLKVTETLRSTSVWKRYDFFTICKYFHNTPFKILFLKS